MQKIIMSALPYLGELEKFFRLRYGREQLPFFEHTSNVGYHKAFHFVLCMPHSQPGWTSEERAEIIYYLDKRNPKKGNIKMLMPEKVIELGGRGGGGWVNFAIQSE